MYQDRREFLKLSGVAALGTLVGGIPLSGLMTSCRSSATAWSAPIPATELEKLFRNPPVAAKPWVFWYWMQAGVSAAGITADLEAMRDAGIGGAYLMPIKGATNPPLTDPPVEQLTPAWWDMMRHAFREADRLGLQMAMHVSDGFALAGGPWITPELSMQKVVWTETFLEGGKPAALTLPQPETKEKYYRDIAVLAFPTPPGSRQTTRTVIPRVTSSKAGADVQFLVDPNTKETFRSDEPCWIQYAFEKPFTCRTIHLRTNGNNYQAHRLLVEASDDGRTFRRVTRLEPPRHGWQDTDADVTHTIEPVTARYFRFTYNKSGSEPGAEDLDSAKWKPSFKVRNIELSGAPRLHQFEGKAGLVWRISRRTTPGQVPAELCVPPDSILDLTDKMDAQGHLNWVAPAGQWTVLRLGHTSTGHTNATGGAGKGLECDKFNPEAIKKQFDGWFGEAVRQAGPDLAARILKVFHVDSWECGSQNWSVVFPAEFQRRRGYDLRRFLPAMAGIPIQSAAVSEQFLFDVRQTVAELVVDVFYGTLKKLAHAQGCVFSAEAIAPTMLSDGLRHYEAVDVPMGEFWLNSPTHDKPNDMLDAISGAHIYGKPVVQAEAFTTVRMAWDEHPGMLKTLGDRNYALGINRMVYHVFTHNPWLNRKPGMTLDGVGLYFQRDQTWWKPGRAWVTYAQRCQALLQVGVPVADIAVFTGEELPRRAVLPDRLVPTLPGLFGTEVVEAEATRLANAGEPQRQRPAGVTHSANMADPENWVDPLRGYAYDSINPDALVRLGQVKDGRLVLPGGASYGLLVMPLPHAMSADRLLSAEVAAKLVQLVKAGATVILPERPEKAPGLSGTSSGEANWDALVSELWRKEARGNQNGEPVGRGRVLRAPFRAQDFSALGLKRDVEAYDASGQLARQLAWTHRQAPGLDIYYLANQAAEARVLQVSLRLAGRVPELYDPVTGNVRDAATWQIREGRTLLPLRLEANASVFVVFQRETNLPGREGGLNWDAPQVVQVLPESWQLQFDPAFGGPKEPLRLSKLMDWSRHPDFGIRHYSGTAVYSQSFTWKSAGSHPGPVWLDLGQVANIAEVWVNGQSCGVAWTPPLRVDIRPALRRGTNEVRIAVSNTWANRLIGDQTLPEDQRVTKTTAPFRLADKPLLPAGLLGPVTLQV